MTVEEIKEQYSMRDIVRRYGIHINRTGFCSCPFHSGDHTPSMKIYPKDFHCHACGANGDIFTFIQKMDNCDFKTAFYSLGGNYQKPSKASEIALYHLKMAREKRERNLADIKSQLQYNNHLIGIYVTWLKRLEPLSDAWCDCMNAYTVCIGRDEYLQMRLKKEGETH